MLFSTKTQYALKALIVLATEGAVVGKKSFLVKELAKLSKVPIPFLGKIISELSAAGIVETRKGRGGGVSLTKSPDKIYLGECLEVTNRVGGQRACVLEKRACREQKPCPLHNVAKKIRQDVLERTTLLEMSRDKKWLFS